MSLKDGLVSFWNNDQDPWNDLHGSNNLTEAGTVDISSGDGPGGQDVSTFNTHGDHLSITSTPITDYYDTWSLSTWVKCDSFNSSTNTIINHRTTGTILYWWLFFRAADSDKITFRLWDASAGFVDVAQTATPSTGTWYHVVVTHDGTGVGDTGLELFINDSSNDTGNTSGLGAVDTASAIFRIGSRWDATNNHDLLGDIGPTGIWNKVLSSSEISQLYNSGNALSYEQLDGAKRRLLDGSLINTNLFNSGLIK